MSLVLRVIKISTLLSLLPNKKIPPFFGGREPPRSSRPTNLNPPPLQSNLIHPLPHSLSLPTSRALFSPFSHRSLSLSLLSEAIAVRFYPHHGLFFFSLASTMLLSSSSSP
ncbi:hypothetical protein RJT34_24064 [Clitoria ternatea]|uniref:Uncharacterized protein n=1 Tax=Clitoria ternatea TaxID=43366 RepID=A0AAN9IH49_CLITE